MTTRSFSPRTAMFHAKLSPAQMKRLSETLASRGLSPSARLLRCGEATLEKIISGAGVSEPARDRLAKALDALPEAS